MDTPKPVPEAEKERLLALLALVRRGVGGERDNALAILTRKLAEHGLTSDSFLAGERGSATRLASDDKPVPEPIPGEPRTLYVAEAVTVRIVPGTTNRLTRERGVGAEVRGNTLFLRGEGVATLELKAPFRTLYFSGAAGCVVSGFSFKDVALHHTGAGKLTVEGAAVRAALHATGDGKLRAEAFAVRSLRLTAAGKAQVHAAAHDLCATVRHRASLRATATRTAAVEAEDAASVVIAGCPPGGRRVNGSGNGKVRWSRID